MSKKYALFLVLTFVSLTVKPQDTVYNFSSSWVPQQLIIHGIRTDLDIRLGKSNNWIILAPQFLLDHRFTGPFDDTDVFGNNEENYYEKMCGAGLESHFRIYLKSQNNPGGLHFSYGLHYSYYNITYSDYGWETTNYDSELEGLTYGIFDYKTIINKIGLNIMIGYQKIFTDRFFMDMYTGAGIRYSFINTSEYSTRNFDNYITSFGYTGALPVFGLRLGVLF